MSQNELERIRVDNSTWEKGSTVKEKGENSKGGQGDAQRATQQGQSKREQPIALDHQISRAPPG